MNARWTDQALEAARRQGDARADELAAELFGKDGSLASEGRSGYNYFQWVVDTMAKNPGLALAGGSTVAAEWQRSPAQLVEYFAPEEAPAWVDADKLKLASMFWEENALAVLGALYAASLPACYLMKKGIAALYQTAKLTDRRYIYQRIYETGLFVEAVLVPGGLNVLVDIARDRAHYADAAAPARPKRYLYGKGFMFARQVRLLHASMRFMLTRPERLAPSRHPSATVAESLNAADWKQQFGDELPINQEDLAYTLLTFGLLIPAALEKWGCRSSVEQKQAFLHLWKTVGHLMGLDETLLTDDLAQAERLFATIRERQAGASEMGCVLTEAVMDFLSDYLPAAFGIAEDVPPLLIREQLGAEYADLIFYERRRRAAEKPLVRALVGAALGCLRLYYAVRHALFKRSATLATFMGGIFTRAAHELVCSWRDQYQRRHFDVPPDARGIPWLDAASLGTLQAWRRKLFYTLMGGVALLIGSGVALGALLFFLGRESAFHNALWLAGGCFVAAVYLLKIQAAGVVNARPKFSAPLPTASG
jgi:hypothetical protein